MKEKELDGTVYKKEIADGVSVVDSVVIHNIDGTEVTWKEEDEKQLKYLFGASMEEEVKKIVEEKKKQKNPQILENVPEEFREGTKKILLEG